LTAKKKKICLDLKQKIFTGCSAAPNQDEILVTCVAAVVELSDTSVRRSIAGPYVEAFCAFATDTSYAVSRH
jgi:hypothetical protein